MYNPILIKLIGGMDEYDSEALPGDEQSQSDSLSSSDSSELDFSIDDYHRSIELIERYNEAFSVATFSLDDLIRCTLQSTLDEDVNIQTLFPIFQLFNFNTGNDYLFYQELGYSPEAIENIFKADPRWYILSRIQQYAHTENEHVSRNFSDLINILQESPVSDNNILFFEARFELIDFILSKYNPQQKELFLSLKYNLDNDLIHEFPYSICSTPYFVDLTSEENASGDIHLITPSGIPFIAKQQINLAITIAPSSEIELPPDVENFLEHKITLNDLLLEYSSDDT